MMKKFWLMMFGVAIISFGSSAIAQATPMYSSHSVAAASNIQDKSVAEQVVTRSKASWPWYLTRGSGLLAAGLLALLVLSGIGLLTGYTYKIMEPLGAWATHRSMGIAFAGSVVVHMVVLLFDRYAPFNVFDILIPFVSGYKPVTIAGKYVGSLHVALGIFAFYAIITVVVSSLIWIDKKPYTWKVLHYLSYFALLAVFVHGLFLGTDLKGGTYRVLWFFGGISVATAIGMRLWRAWTISKVR